MYRRPNCVDLANPDYEKFAAALGADYVPIFNDYDVEQGLYKALSSERLCLVDARVKYFKMTRYFKGVALANLRRATATQKWRFLSRGIRRTIFR